MRTTVHLPDDLLARAKKKAAADGRTLTSLIEEGLRTILAQKAGGRGKQQRARLPISSVHDGVLDGVDLTSNARLQELMDDNAVRRPVKRK
jgi:hypothetical protein